jgi:glycosyltransferase involved in cell wall biosynthesis
LGWDAYEKADGFVALTNWEAELMRTMFRANPDKIRVIANGVESIFFSPPTGIESRADYLVSTATIHPRKRVLELAEAAAQAKIPIWIIGRPYSESDPYFLQFLEMQRRHSAYVRYEGAIDDRAELARAYQHARGFVLLSTNESLSLSALEAAAAKCPLLLSDLPWAKSFFGAHATYASASEPCHRLAFHLKDFFDRAPSIKDGIKPPTWDEVADQLMAFYHQCWQGAPAQR